MAIIIKGTSMKAQDMVKANISGMIKVTIKANGNRTKCMDLENMLLFKVWLLRDCFKMINLLEITSIDVSIIFI